MNTKELQALTEAVIKAALRGRREDGNALFDHGIVGFSIVYGKREGNLGRAVLLCAVGPAGQEAKLIPYGELPSNNEVRRKVSGAVRALVTRVEGMQTASAGRVQ